MNVLNIAVRPGETQTMELNGIPVTVERTETNTKISIFPGRWRFEWLSAWIGYLVAVLGFIVITFVVSHLK